MHLYHKYKINNDILKICRVSQEKKFILISFIYSLNRLESIFIYLDFVLLWDRLPFLKLTTLTTNIDSFINI